MFLTKLFKKSNKPKQIEKDYLKFTIDLSQNVPKYEQQADPQNNSDDQRISPNHPLYAQIFKGVKLPEQNTYTTTQNDSLTGIAMKLGVSENSLRSINNISSALYPGTVIRLPIGCDRRMLEQDEVTKPEKLSLGQALEINDSGANSQTKKWDVWYSGGSVGLIYGTLTANRNYLIFSPALQHPKNLHKLNPQQLLKYNVVIETTDIEEVRAVQPSKQGQPGKLVLTLIRIGHQKVDKKYSQKLKEEKSERKAFASVNFTAYDFNLVQEQVSIIVASGQSQPQEQTSKKALTTIPCFEILSNTEQSPDKEIYSPAKDEKTQLTEPQPRKKVGQLIGPSSIVTEEQFYNLAQSIPVLYQMYNWSCVYNSTKDGSSFNTFLNKAKNCEPAILFIKEYKGYTMGAFLIQSLQTGKTGRGEMFIFSYKDKKDPEVYKWTGKNETFVYCEKGMGLGIGMGFKYGIFMKHDMDKGSSCSTYTFGNTQILSKKQDFFVDEVQLWTVDSSF